MSPANLSGSIRRSMNVVKNQLPAGTLACESTISRGPASPDLHHVPTFAPTDNQTLRLGRGSTSCGRDKECLDFCTGAEGSLLEHRAPRLQLLAPLRDERTIFNTQVSESAAVLTTLRVVSILFICVDLHSRASMGGQSSGKCRRALSKEGRSSRG